MTSRDKALDALSEFDRQVAIRRQELIDEFDVEAPSAAPVVKAEGAAANLAAAAAQKAG
ncbi:MAG: hypothetical protein H0T47_20565 [Planctomycetaceae bacterium]|nr:hypothetical protein [Planctomycetaceae bacterium]